MEKRIQLSDLQYRFFIGLCCLVGSEGSEYIDAVVDEVEWTNPRYYHQN